ncbi:MAG: hypothetical protein CMK09_12355 [Ponticaulis sp.]|nr:hypothetical protein [Ponticaulis sp.]|tara:strand:+ start:7310 stop:8062 length:753 start_codon:yes stop_codon:yes gene_type:complete
MFWRLALALILCVSAVCCSNAPGENWVKGETGAVSRVLDGDTFALNTGQIVRLVSVEAPRTGSRDRDPEPFADEAKEILESLALGRTVQLYYPGMTQDRYDRALAQVYAYTETGEKIWLNEALVQKGAVWVRLYDDTSRGSEPLVNAERVARRMQTGLWSNASPETTLDLAQAYMGRFAILSGSLTFKARDETDCVYSLAASELTIQYDQVMGACWEPSSGVKYEIRGWVNNGKLYAGSADNIVPIDPEV